jgi:MraZ protein
LKYLGRFEVTLDVKGRFLLPKALREKLPEGERTNFVVSGASDNAPCLYLYTEKQFDIMYEQHLELEDNNPEVAMYLRLVFSEAVPVSLDSSDRLLLDKGLMQLANITKDVIIISAGKKMELWDAEIYRNYVREHRSQLPKLSSQMGSNSVYKKQP